MKKASLLLTIPLVILTGCIGSKHLVPHHKMPHTFEYQCCQEKSQDISQWWQTFNDPYLNELIEKAVAGNYSLALAIERIEQARSLYQFEQARLFPQIDGVAEITRTKVSTVLAQTSFLSNDKVSFFQLGFDGAWEIDFWGKIWRERQGRYYQYEAQIETMRDVYIILLADVARTYISLCALNQQSAVLVELMETNRLIVQLQKDLFKAGLSSEIELAQAKQQLAQSVNDYEALVAQRVVQKNALAVLLGSNPEDFQMPPRSSVPYVSEPLATGMPSELLRRRPDIRQRERELAARNAFVGQAIAEWFPSFVLIGGVSSQTSQGSEWFTGPSLSWNIGPSIRWPIINFGRINAVIKERESQRRQAVLAYSQTVIEALQEVENFFVNYYQNKEQRESIIYKRMQADTETQLQNDKFKSGLVNQITYLDTMRTLLDIQLQEIQITANVSVNLASLYKALGGGW